MILDCRPEVDARDVFLKTAVRDHVDTVISSPLKPIREKSRFERYI